MICHQRPKQTLGSNWMALHNTPLVTRSQQYNGFICSVRAPPDTMCSTSAMQQMQASFCGVDTRTVHRPCIVIIMPLRHAWAWHLLICACQASAREAPVHLYFNPTATQHPACGMMTLRVFKGEDLLILER